MVIKVSNKGDGGGYRTSITPLQPFGGGGLSYVMFLKRYANIAYSLISLNILISYLISNTSTVTLEVVL